MHGMTVVPLHQVSGRQPWCTYNNKNVPNNSRHFQGSDGNRGTRARLGLRTVYQSPDQVLPLLAATDSVFDMDKICACS